MTTCLRGCVVVLVSAAVACASEKGAEKKPGVEAQAAPAIAAGLADGAWLSYDERGAYGPYTLHHLDVAKDNSVQCRRRATSGEETVRTVKLTDAEVATLGDALTRDNPFSARQVARQGSVSDVGTTTLTVVGKDGRTASLVIDATHVVEPAQTDVITTIAAMMQACLGSAP